MKFFNTSLILMIFSFLTLTSCANRNDNNEEATPMDQKMSVRLELSAINNSGVSINLKNLTNKFIAAYLGIVKPFALFIFDEQPERISPSRTIAKKVPRDYKKPISAVAALLQPNQNLQLKVLYITGENDKFKIGWSQGLYFYEYTLLPGTYRFKIESDFFAEESSKVREDITFDKDQLVSIESNELELILEDKRK